MSDLKRSQGDDQGESTISKNNRLGQVIGWSAGIVGVAIVVVKFSSVDVNHALILFGVAIVAAYFPKIYKLHFEKLGISIEQYSGLKDKVDVTLEHSRVMKEKIDESDAARARLNEEIKLAEKRMKDLEIEVSDVFKVADEKLEEIQRALSKLQGLEKDFRVFVGQTIAVSKGTREYRCEAGYDPGPVENDPRKGVFGGNNRSKGLLLEAKITQAEALTEYYNVHLSVVCTDLSMKMECPVCFYLHDSFRPDMIPVVPSNNEATLDLLSYGAFTVGAVTEVEGQEIKLELDLAELGDVPAKFKSR